MQNKKNILLVEDEAAVRSVLFRKLTQKGYHVVTAGTFKEALDFISSSFHINLALIDLKLPDGDGLDLITQTRKHHPQAECIIMTGFGSIELAVEASKKGAFQFVTKPFELMALIQVIERAFHHRDVLNENHSLKSQLQSQQSLSCLVGKSPTLTRTIDLARRVSDSDSTILIKGESGTGKELIAKLIHETSPRSQGPFVAVNCGALSDDLLESELFGHKKGSFTGAVKDRKGRFCLAQNGTLFLDEVGDMSPRLQVKLLRALQEKSYEAVGGQTKITSNARIITATHKDLNRLVAQGKFREDLFYRLNVIPLKLPALRERKSDVPLLIHHFISKFNKEKNRRIEGMSRDAFEALCEHSWPGNIRELENLIERLTIIKASGVLTWEDLPSSYRIQTQAVTPTPTVNTEIPFPEEGLDFNSIVNDFENRIILKALEKTGWNKNKAAKLLRLNRTTLIEKIKKKGLEKPKPAEAAI